MKLTSDIIDLKNIKKNFSTWLGTQKLQAQNNNDQALSRSIDKLIEKWHHTEVTLDFFCEEKSHEDVLCLKTKRPSITKNIRMIFIWLLMISLVLFSIHYKLDQRITAGGFILVGLVSHAFAWLVGVVALVPIIGPLIVKILSIPIIWLLNSVGYILSVVAIRRGYSKDVLTYRGLTISLIIGIVVGYILGKLI